MRKVYTVGLIILAGLLCSCKTVYPQSNSTRHKPDYYLHQTKQYIVGTWLSTGGGSKWVFKKNSKLTTYIKKDIGKPFKLYDTYTYNIYNSGKHCGVDVGESVQEYPMESILVMKNKSKNIKECMIIYGITKDHLSMRLSGTGKMLFFEKNE